MEQSRAKPDNTNPTNPAPSSRNRPAPSPPPGSRLVPVAVAQPGARPLGPLQFVFYRPQWPNSLAPFCTAQKPSCGARFQEGTRHCRSRMDVPSAEPSKWRTCYHRKP